MCAWVFDIALAAVLNAGRYDLGFYAGRVYGLIASSIVLVMMLIEYGRLYARLAAAYESETQEHIRTQERAYHELQISQERLEASEEQYRQLFDGNPLPMWLYDPHTLRFTAVNDMAIRTYGYTREEFQTLTIHAIRPPEEISQMVERVREMNEADGGRVGKGIWRHKTKNGTLIDMEVWLSLIHI